MHPASTSIASALLAEIRGSLGANLQAVEVGCAARLHSQGPVPEDFVRLIDRSRSRLLRPALLLVASRLCGYRGDSAIHYATAVELIHRATLIHRTIGMEPPRSHPAGAWRLDLAVLLGDYLYVSAMQLALSPDRHDIVQLICQATGRTFEGELYQLSTTRQAAVSESDDLEMVVGRKASLFAASAEIGARLGRVDVPEQRALAQYGFGLGMALQLLGDGAVTPASARALQHAETARNAITTFPTCAEHDLLVSLLDLVVAPSAAAAPSSQPPHVLRA